MPKGIQTGSYSVPEIKQGSSFAQVPDANVSARGDMPATGTPANAGTQGYKGPAEMTFENKSTAHISKLGPK